MFLRDFRLENLALTTDYANRLDIFVEFQSVYGFNARLSLILIFTPRNRILCSILSLCMDIKCSRGINFYSFLFWSEEQETCCFIFTTRLLAFTHSPISKRPRFKLNVVMYMCTLRSLWHKEDA